MKQMGNIEQCLQDLGYAIVPVTGTSMWPLLCEGKSRVQLVKTGDGPLKRGDIVLYRRHNGTKVLHRIIKIKNKNTFLVCGDHQWKLEEQIQKDQILAVAQGFFRNGHYVDDSTWWYRLYKAVWNGNLTVRRGCLAFLRLSGLESRAGRGTDP